VEVRIGWEPTGRKALPGDYYQVKRWDTLHAEVRTIEELAAIVPLHELVEVIDEPSATRPQ
jgi:hypothetical protein